MREIRTSGLMSGDGKRATASRSRTAPILDSTRPRCLTWCGLATYYVLFVVQLETRRVTLAGMTRNPTEEWQSALWAWQAAFTAWIAASAHRSLCPSMRRKCCSMSSHAEATQRCAMSASRLHVHECP
jgi:hypothetical protein